jgi:hypothetical protein
MPHPAAEWVIIMEFKKDDNDIQWQKETETDKRRFDFAAFLGPDSQDSLDDRVTEVMDGKDLLEPDAFDHIAPDYIPRRPTDGEHGRHEAPTTEDFQPDAPPTTPERPAVSAEDPRYTAPERPAMNPNDPRYAAPERPHVVVADPHPKRVYVSPVGDDYDSTPASGGGGGKKGLVGAIVVLAIIAVVLLSLLGSLFGGSDDDDAQATPKPTSPSASTQTQALLATDRPSSDNNSTQTTKRSYTITVTAGSGGSISPAGAVTVEEGGSVTFTIQPNSGNAISQLLIDGSAVDPQSSYTFSNVTQSHTIYAVFQSAATATPTPTNTPEPTAPPTPDPTAEPTPDPTEPPPQDEPAAPESDPIDAGADAAAE